MLTLANKARETIDQALEKSSSYASERLPNISLARFLPYPVLLPSSEEQFQIVAEVDRHLSVIDELEANLTRGDRLRQSILSSAFSGKLAALGKTQAHSDVSPVAS